MIMIVDSMTNIENYGFSDSLLKGFNFLENLSPDVVDGEYEIEGRNIFAVIDSYKTRDKSNAFLEAHKEYIDIQYILKGSEIIECRNCDGLTISEPYDKNADIMFFAKTTLPSHSIAMEQGTFAVFYPCDAHMPSLNPCNEKTNVKKVVIKIKAISGS